MTLKYYARWIPSGQVHRVNILDAEDQSNTGLTPQESQQHLTHLLLTYLVNRVDGPLIGRRQGSEKRLQSPVIAFQIRR